MPDRPLPSLPPLPEDEPATVEQAAAAPPPPATPPASPPAPPRRWTDDEEPPRRRQWSAGHALIVSRPRPGDRPPPECAGDPQPAYNKPDGWSRDVTIAFTGPLADVSHALLLDRPRVGVQALIGRSGSDEIDTEIALPESPTTTPRTTPKPPTGSTSKPKPTAPAMPKKVAFTPDREAEALGRRRLARDHALVRDRPRGGVEPRDRVGWRGRRPRRDRPHPPRRLQLVR